MNLCEINELSEISVIPAFSNANHNHLRAFPRSMGYFFLILTLFISSFAYADAMYDSGLLKKQILDWRTAQINEVSSIFTEDPRIETENERSCMISSLLNIDVSDDYAFDIDEDVEIIVEFDLAKGSKDVTLRYDKNGDFAGVTNVQLPAHWKNRYYSHKFSLERARFAGRHIGSEIGAVGNLVSGDFYLKSTADMAVCSITLKRSYATANPISFGKITLNILDELGDPIPARVGIYDTSGRMPLPSLEALPIKYAAGTTRVVTLNSASIPWPEKNRQAFYVNGRYHATLPVGHYRIIVARGPEYRIVENKFEIEADEDKPVDIVLTRWIDMASRGWYSGDTHIHASRRHHQDSIDTHIQMRAEDLNVANLLPIGRTPFEVSSGVSIGDTENRKYNWGHHARFGKAPYALVPGQENPITARGHALILNINDPILNTERHFLYHEIFKKGQQHNGLTGYAHVRDDPAWVSVSGAGLALDVPYGLVDFVEILQQGMATTQIWFDFLNLGYKLVPSAGTDYPFLDVPGAVRNYVDVGEDFSTQGWFDGLKAGRTFVTNGPMLEMTINGEGIGSDVYVRKGELLMIDAKVAISPDISQLERLQLIQQGEVVAETVFEEGATELHLKHKVRADYGSWFVLKAHAKKSNSKENMIAISAPIYVNSGGDGFCKPSAIPSIVAKMKMLLQGLLVKDIKSQYWRENKIHLQRRVDEVNSKYDELIERAKRQKCIGA